MAATSSGAALQPLFRTFCDAASHVTNSTDGDDITAVQARLFTLQQHPQAWELYQYVLDHNDLFASAYQLAATGLRFKLESTHNELDDDGRAALRTCLINHMRKHPGKDSLEVCHCVAMLIGQWDEWEHPLEDVWKELCEHPPLLCNMLMVCTDVARYSRKYQHCREKTLEFAGSFLQLLEQGIKQVGVDPTRELTLFVCVATATWLDNGLIQHEHLASHPVIQWLFSSIRAVPWMEDAIDALTSLSQFWSTVNDPAIVAALMENVVQLGPVFDTFRDEPNRQQRLCKFLLGVAEAYLPYLLADPPHLQLLEVIVDCMNSTPSLPVAAAFGGVWYPVMRSLGRRIDSTGLQEKLRPLGGRAIHVILALHRVPPNLSRADDKFDDFKRLRFQLQDCLADVVSIVGTDMLVRILSEAFAVAKSELQADEENWRGMEATLYALRGTARQLVDLHENAQPFITQFRQMVLTYLPTLQQSHEALAYTATLVVGRFADWLNRHREFTAPCLSFVVSQLNRPEVCDAAALAFKHVCDACAEQLAQADSLAMLFKLYEQTRTLHILNQKDIIGGLCYVVCKVSPDKQAPAVYALIRPIAEDIQKALTSYAEVQATASGAKQTDSDASAQNATETLQTDMMHCLDRLSAVFQAQSLTDEKSSENVRVALAVAVQTIEPLMSVCVQMFKANDRIIERWCRVWKYVIRACGGHFGPKLKGLVATLSEHMAQPPQSAFLYLLGLCVGQFASDTQHEEVLKQIIQLMVDRTLPHLADLDRMVKYEDVTEDFFDGLTRVLKHMPHLIVSDDALDLIIQRAIMASPSANKQVSQGGRLFLGQLFRLAVGVPGKDKEQLVRLQDELPAVETVVSVELKQRVYEAWKLHGSEAIAAMMPRGGRVNRHACLTLAIFCTVDLPFFFEELQVSIRRLVPDMEEQDIQGVLQPVVGLILNGQPSLSLLRRAIRGLMEPCAHAGSTGGSRPTALEDD